MENLPRIAGYWKHYQPKREKCVASNTTVMAKWSKSFDVRQGAIGNSFSSVLLITLTKHRMKLFKGRRMYFSSCWQSPNLCAWLLRCWMLEEPNSPWAMTRSVCSLRHCLYGWTNYSCKVICVLSCWQLEPFPSSLVFVQGILKMLSNAFALSYPSAQPTL